MLIPLIVPSLALLVGPIVAGYVTVPLQSPAGVTYVNSQQHVGLLAGPVRYTSATAAAAVPLVDARSGAVSVTPGPAPTYYSYNVQPQTVFGKASYTPAVQYHQTSYGGPTVRVYEPKSFVYGVHANNPIPSTHTVHTVSVPTTQFHHAPEPVPVTPAPHHPTIAVPVPVPTPVPVHVPVHVPVAVPVTPTYTKTVTTGPTYVAPQEKHVPVVRSRKFKVRRPAIQNQFYDIEERVIIRPVGSALVELEQPISQTETQSKTTKTTSTTTFVQKQPPVYIPAPPPPPPPQEEVPSVDSGYGTRIAGRPRVVTQTTTVYTERPQVVVQKNTYDRVRVSAHESTQSAASTSKSSDAEFIDTSPADVPLTAERPFYTQGHAVYHPQQTAYVPHPFAAPLAPHPFVYHPGNTGHLLHHVGYLDQHHSLVAHPATSLHPASVLHPVQATTPLYPVTPVAVPAPGNDCDREGKAPEYLPPTQTPSATPPVATTTPQPPTASSPGPLDDAEEEYDDSIVVDARSSAGEGNDKDYDYSTASGYEEAVRSTTVSSTTSGAPTYRNHDKYRGSEQDQSQSQSQSQSHSQSQARSSIEISYATRTTPASDIVAFDPSTSAGVFNLGPSPPAFRGSFSTTTAASPTTISLDGSSSSAASSTPQRSVTIISSTTPRTVSARFSGAEASAGRLESSSTSAAISSHSVVVGQGLTQEQIHANQEQFIKLLSERDSIAQVGFDPKGDTSGTLIDAYVRSRVLSATPAPRDAKETSRTVNIRRIVVSRPVETEQEVEVHEQGYATTISPLAHEHKRDVSDVASARSDATSDDSHQPPVYVNAKPPAFVNEQRDK